MLINSRNIKRTIAAFITLVMVLCCFVGCSNGKSANGDSTKDDKYNAALKHIADKNYSDAYNILKELGDYKDAEEHLGYFCYVPTKITNQDGEFLNIATTYGKNNLPTKFICTGLSDDDKHTLTFTFNSNGTITKITKEFVIEDLVEEHYNVTYDANGNISKIVFIACDGDEYTYEYTYNDAGEITKCKYSDYWDKSTTTYSYDHDSNGRITKKTESSSSGYEQSWNYTYNEAGLLIKEIYTDSNDYSETINYEYSENGNLIKKTFLSEYGTYFEEYDSSLVYIPSSDFLNKLQFILETGNFY